MVAQWNIGGVHPTSMSDAGVYMMKSSDGIAFEPMFANRSLDWSDTKNVMFWSRSPWAVTSFSCMGHENDFTDRPWLRDTFGVIGTTFRA